MTDDTKGAEVAHDKPPPVVVTRDATGNAWALLPTLAAWARSAGTLAGDELAAKLDEMGGDQ